MKHICATCKLIIEDMQEAARVILEGCPRCGKKKISKNVVEYQPNENNEINDDIDIVMKGQGEFIFNLKTLAGRMDDDPIIIADTKGKLNILFNTDE